MNETFIPTQLARKDMDRLKTYKELLDFYHGVHWEGRTFRGEKRLTFNYAKVLIDKVTSYLISGINFALKTIELSTPEMELRGKLLLIAFPSFCIGAFLDALIPTNAITLIVFRLILISSAIEFYLGFTLPDFIKKSLLKE